MMESAVNIPILQWTSRPAETSVAMDTRHSDVTITGKVFSFDIIA
jgi:hypothetical protein